MTEAKEQLTMERMRVSIRKARHNWTWTIHSFLSLSVMCALLDSFPIVDMTAMELIAFGISCFSLVVTTIISAMHYNEYSKEFVGGTLIELAMAVVLQALWIVAAIVIQDPENDIASTIDTTGVELIKQANLFFFTWFTLFCNVYLVASFFRDYKTYDLRVVCWVSLLAISLMLLGIASHLVDGICDVDEGAMCFRTKYAMASGAVVASISLIGSVLSYMYKVSPNVGLILSSPTAAIYSFGVAMLTSSNGPARTLGTIYFTIWIGSIISILLLIGEFNKIFLNGNEAEEPTPKFHKRAEMRMDESSA